jgi:KDO2-lipid IV(A) lauroyltransferase
MKEEDLTSRIFFKNPEVLSKYFKEGKSVVAIAAHYGNWEWTAGLGKSAKHHTIAIYKPLSNPLFNQFMKDHRAKFGTELVSMRDSIRVLLEYKKTGIPTLSLFIADQSPVWEEIQYWTKFMNQETPVYLGPEKIATRFNMAVVFLKVNPLSKGIYEVEIIPVTEDASREENFFVTEKHVELLENTIRERPEFWLWSHRRWKLTRKREREEAAGIHRFKGSFKKN